MKAEGSGPDLHARLEQESAMTTGCLIMLNQCVSGSDKLMVTLRYLHANVL